LETADLLRARLRIVVALFLADSIVFTARDLLQGDTSGWQWRSALVLGYLAAAVLIFSSMPLTLARLRGLELAIVGAFALALAVYYYQQVLQWTLDGNGTLAPGQADVLAFPFFVVIVCYAVFIPAGWRRALGVAGALSVMPFLVLLAVRVQAMEQAGVVLRLSTVELTTLAFVSVFEIIIAVLGVHTIHSLRAKAFEAKQLGHYRLKERIGSGGMGEVWEAEHHLLASPAAIKLIRPEMVAAGDTPAAQAVLRRFEREAKATASLQSPHTVAVHDFGIAEDGTFYYVMEMLPGLDLERLVRRFGPLQPSRVIHLLGQVCESLSEAHDRGLIHRDVKPANIFTCRLGRSHDFIKLVDFGLVKSHGAALEDEASLTQEGSLIGTPAYMAPEAILGKTETGPRADIYSLGCVGYWLLTGETVFDGENAIAVAVAHVQSTPTPPSQRSNLEIPPALDEVILACLEKDPDDRPQEVEEVRRLLNECPLPGESSWDESRAEEWWALHMTGEERGA
jgi:serine/threonine-protein kinase